VCRPQKSGTILKIALIREFPEQDKLKQLLFFFQSDKTFAGGFGETYLPGNMNRLTPANRGPTMACGRLVKNKNYHHLRLVRHAV